MKLKSKIRLQKFENREVDSVFEVELMQLSNIISCNLAAASNEVRCASLWLVREPEIYSIAHFC